LGPDNKIPGRLEIEVKDKIDMKEFSKCLVDNKTGLSTYAGMLSPIRLEDDPNLELGASQGSRFFNGEGFYRSHDGIDFAAAGGTQTVSTLNGSFTHDQNSGILKIYTDDGKYKVVYMHMPPDSFKDANNDGRVTVGDDLGKVGGWGYKEGVGYSNTAYGAHLHYEVWEWKTVPVLNKETNKIQDVKMFVPIDPRTVDLSSYQTKQGENK
jgi:murein DD-endopeptidase MepM/ murein hydrolase activator NlpD